VADEYGCDCIATGHYARIAERDGHVYLRTAADTRKDQTYFLWMLTEEQLRRTVFPLGDLTKDEVREIARRHGYEKLAAKRESQEICFIPDDDYRAFLRANVPDYNERVRAGEYVDAEGRVLGMHEGYVNYTIGQRKGLGIALGHPAYVTHIDAATNRITLGTNEDMYATELVCNLSGSRPVCALSGAAGLTAKVRYRTPAVPAKVSDITDTVCRLTFDSPVWGVTPGQSVVLYQDGLVLAGGIISRSNA
jgi:tRNA-specific 2-thiouridylase